MWFIESAQSFLNGDLAEASFNKMDHQLHEIIKLCIRPETPHSTHRTRLIIVLMVFC